MFSARYQEDLLPLELKKLCLRYDYGLTTRSPYSCSREWSYFQHSALNAIVSQSSTIMILVKLQQTQYTVCWLNQSHLHVRIRYKRWQFGNENHMSRYHGYNVWESLSPIRFLVICKCQFVNSVERLGWNILQQLPEEQHRYFDCRTEQKSISSHSNSMQSKLQRPGLELMWIIARMSGVLYPNTVVRHNTELISQNDWRITKDGALWYIFERLNRNTKLTISSKSFRFSQDTNRMKQNTMQ